MDFKLSASNLILPCLPRNTQARFQAFVSLLACDAYVLTGSGYSYSPEYTNPLPFPLTLGFVLLSAHLC